MPFTSQNSRRSQSALLETLGKMSAPWFKYLVDKNYILKAVIGCYFKHCIMVTSAFHS